MRTVEIGAQVNSKTEDLCCMKMRFLHTKIHHHFYLFNNERLAQFAFSFAMYLQKMGGFARRREGLQMRIDREGRELPALG